MPAVIIDAREILFSCCYIVLEAFVYGRRNSKQMGKYINRRSGDEELTILGLYARSLLELFGSSHQQLESQVAFT